MPHYHTSVLALNSKVTLGKNSNTTVYLNDTPINTDTGNNKLP